MRLTRSARLERPLADWRFLAKVWHVRVMEMRAAQIALDPACAERKRRRNGWSEERRSEVERTVWAMRTNGCTYQEIARAVGISNDTVRNILRDMQTRLKIASEIRSEFSSDVQVLKSQNVETVGSKGGYQSA